MGHKSQKVWTRARSELPRCRNGRLCHADEWFDSMGGDMYEWTRSSASSDAFFGGMPCTRVVRYRPTSSLLPHPLLSPSPAFHDSSYVKNQFLGPSRAPLSPPLSSPLPSPTHTPTSRSVGGLQLGCAKLCGIGWWRKRVRHSVCQTTPNRPWPVCSSRSVSQVSPGRWIAAHVLLRRNGGSIFRLHVEYDQPPADACRWDVGDKYGLPGETFFLTLKWNSSRKLALCPARQTCVHNTSVAESDHGRYPQVWSPSSSGGQVTGPAGLEGYDLL